MLSQKGKAKSKSAFVAAAITAAALASPAWAETVITDFGNFNLSGTYASWATGTITSGATDYRTQATGGFGGGFYDIDPNINAAGEITLSLDVVLNPGNQAGGVVVVLVDDDITQFNYAWYGLANGSHTLTADLFAPSFISNEGSTPGLDVSNLSFFHIQGDSLGTTDISWDHMVLTPEPASLVVMGLGALTLLRRRRVGQRPLQ